MPTFVPTTVSLICALNHYALLPSNKEKYPRKRKKNVVDVERPLLNLAGINSVSHFHSFDSVSLKEGRHHDCHLASPPLWGGHGI